MNSHQSSMASTREETSRVVFLEAWVEFVIANAGD